MSDPRFNLVSFRYGASRAFGKLEGPFTWTAGIEPSINRLVVPAAEFAKIAADLGQLGVVEFWFTSSPTAVKNPDPDHKISGIRVVDLEAATVAVPQGGTTPEITAYRLYLSDARERWVPPRGGRLAVGPINPKPDPLSLPWKTTGELVALCLSRMGTDISFDELPAELVATPAPQNWEWNGNHAPSELAKLLDYCRAALCPQSDGTMAIEMCGPPKDAKNPDGNRNALPSIPAGRQVYDLSLPAPPRRGKTIIYTSGANPCIWTRTILGVNDQTWEFVVQDEGGNWIPMNVADALTNLAGGFTSVPEKARKRMDDQAFRCLRLRRSYQDAAILRQTWFADVGGSPEVFAGPFAVAPIARPNKDGVWTNASIPVFVDVAAIHGGRVLQLADRLIKITAGSASLGNYPLSPLALGDGDLMVTASFSAVDATGAPLPFSVGFRMEVGGALIQLTADEVASALAGEGQDVVIIERPELVLVEIEGKQPGLKDLIAMAKGWAAADLAGSGQPVREIQATGFLAGELSGQVAEIRYDQDALTTTFKINTWWSPSGAVRDVKGMRALNEPYPQAARIAGGKLARGETGALQPVVPVMPAAGGGVAAAAAAPAALWVYVTGTETGQGKYKGKILAVAGVGGTSTADKTADLAIPGWGLSLPTSEDALLLLPADALPSPAGTTGTATTHRLQTPAWVLAVDTGAVTTETPPRRVLLALAGLPTPANTYDLLKFGSDGFIEFGDPNMVG